MQCIHLRLDHSTARLMYASMRWTDICEPKWDRAALQKTPSFPSTSCFPSPRPFGPILSPTSRLPSRPSIRSILLTSPRSASSPQCPFSPPVSAPSLLFTTLSHPLSCALLTSSYLSPLYRFSPLLFPQSPSLLPLPALLSPNKWLPLTSSP